MRPFLLLLLALFFCSSPIQPAAVFANEPLATSAAHDDNPLELSEDKQKFRKSLLKAIQESRKEGKITAREAMKLRIASWSPAFVERAQQLAVVQIAFSGESASEVPYTDDGRVDVLNIDWEGLIKFLEVLLPFLLKILAGI